MKTLTIPNDIMFKQVSELTAQGESVSFMTKGSSMLPFIRGDRDSVRIKKFEQYHVGDIALVRLSNGQYILHRIISIKGNKVTLQGDGNIRGTEHCTLEDVIGGVTAIIAPSGREKKPTSGAWWRKIKPLRRYILAIYRRLPKSLQRSW
ncbi:MAG: S24/S26 family peptidase [Alistipes sp.]|nr:S24/S26 family peptidase [Candidatus Alistipes equi]